MATDSILNPYGEEEEVPPQKNIRQSHRASLPDLRDAFPEFVYDWMGDQGILDKQWRNPRFRKKYMEDFKVGFASEIESLVDYLTGQER